MQDGIYKTTYDLAIRLISFHDNNGRDIGFIVPWQHHLFWEYNKAHIRSNVRHRFNSVHHIG
jgi:hypothetical protein